MAADNELPVWTIRPNWRNGILERLDWLTDVMGSTYGTEQRRALRLSPRRTFEMTFNPFNEVRSYFDLWLHRLGSSEFMLPLFHDKGRLSAPVTAAQATIPLDTTFREFEAGGMAVILSEDDPFTFDVLEISAVSNTQLTITGLGHAWPAGTTVYPLRRSRISQESLFGAITSNVGEATLQFDLNQSNDIDDEGAWPLSYLGVPIILDKPNRRERMDFTYIRNSLVMDNDIGLRDLLDDAGRAFTIQTYSKMMRGRAEHWAFRQMLYRLRGQAMPVWLPTFNRDLVLGASRLAAHNYIDVKKIGYQYTGGLIDGREHVLLAGSTAKAISGVGVAPSPAHERLTLSTTLGSNFAAGTAGSFLEMVRLNNDAVEITHHTDTDGVAESTLAFRAFRDERTADENVEYPIPGVGMRSAPCGQVFSQIVNISSRYNCRTTYTAGIGVGVTISGFDPSNVLRCTMPAGQQYGGWSPWGRPSPANCNAPNASNASGTKNNCYVAKDKNPNNVVQIGKGTCYSGYVAPAADFGEEFLTGASSYTFFFRDDPYSDNTGGLSILVELV